MPLAEPGEFVRRAFENGKLDLAQIEGLAWADRRCRDRCPAAAGSRSSAGSLPQALRKLAVAIDRGCGADGGGDRFPDEGDVSHPPSQKREDRAHIEGEIAAHLDDGHRGEILRDGFRVALLGAPDDRMSVPVAPEAQFGVAVINPQSALADMVVVAGGVGD